jgi:hypothetical protein
MNAREVERIVAIADPAIRNLEITYCYSRMAAAVAERGTPGANWCTFATWASRQAGHTIRGEDMSDWLEHELGRGAELGHPIRSLSRWLLGRGRLTRLHTPFDAITLASDAVARGNPPTEPPLLRNAFARYVASTDAELIMLANLEIGLHEQTRLQPEILEAMDAAVAPKRRQRLFGGPVQRELTRLSRALITRSLMVLTLPDIVLALGRNIDVALAPPTDAELVALLARYEPVPPAVDDCGAEDWSVLDQRMHFIAHLFRAYHADPSLASPPFTPAQIERFRAGKLPDGEL